MRRIPKDKIKWRKKIWKIITSTAASHRETERAGLAAETLAALGADKLVAARAAMEAICKKEETVNRVLLIRHYHVYGQVRINRPCNLLLP